jgi:hypothetical protein
MFQQPTPSSVSPLRRRMFEDMATRGLREETQRDYIRCGALLRSSGGRRELCLNVTQLPDLTQ